MTVTGGRDPKEMNVRVSARAFLDFIAGRTTVEQFRASIGQRDGEKNLFAHWLDQGFIMKEVCIEPGGLDKDDDYLLISFGKDPSALPMQRPESINRGPPEKPK